MIKSFKHKGLEQLFLNGTTKGINKNLAPKILIRLDFLNKIIDVSELPLNFKCHPLKGDKKNLFSIVVTGNYRITFELINGDVYIVNYEDYH